MNLEAKVRIGCLVRVSYPREYSHVLQGQVVRILVASETSDRGLCEAWLGEPIRKEDRDHMRWIWLVREEFDLLSPAEELAVKLSLGDK